MDLTAAVAAAVAAATKMPQRGNNLRVIRDALAPFHRRGKRDVCDNYEFFAAPNVAEESQLPLIP